MEIKVEPEEMIQHQPSEQFVVNGKFIVLVHGIYLVAKEGLVGDGQIDIEAAKFSFSVCMLLCDRT